MRFTRAFTFAAALLMPSAALGQTGVQAVDIPGPGGAASFGFQSGFAGGTANSDDGVNAVLNVAMPASLEEAIERSMKGNPEIALAVANRRQAEMAENLTRNKVTQDVVQTYKQWQFDQRALKSAEAKHQAATISESELLVAKEAVMKSETALQFLLGGYTVLRTDTRAGAVGEMPMMGGGMRSLIGAPIEVPLQGGAGVGGPAIVGGGLAPGGVTGDPMGSGGDLSGGAGGSNIGLPAASGPPAKFHEQLAQIVGPVDYQGMPVDDFAKRMTDLCKVPVIVDHRTFDDTGGELNFQITLSLQSDSLTWHDVLTAIADTHDIGFIVRDYGILITTKQKTGLQGFGGGGFGAGSGIGGGGGGGF